jgi:hypothetical protein
MEGGRGREWERERGRKEREEGERERKERKRERTRLCWETRFSGGSRACFLARLYDEPCVEGLC